MRVTRQPQKTALRKRAETSPESSGASATGKRLLDRVVDAAAAKREERYKTWRDRLTQSQLEEVLEIKAALIAGDIGIPARSLAKAIIEDFERQGVRVCSLHTLNQWLLEK